MLFYLLNMLQNHTFGGGREQEIIIMQTVKKNFDNLDILQDNFKCTLDIVLRNFIIMNVNHQILNVNVVIVNIFRIKN